MLLKCSCTLMRQIFATLVVGLNGCFWGMIIGYSAVALPSFEDDPKRPFNMTDGDKAFFGENPLLLFLQARENNVSFKRERERIQNSFAAHNIEGVVWCSSWYIGTSWPLMLIRFSPVLSLQILFRRTLSNMLKSTCLSH